MSDSVTPWTTAHEASLSFAVSLSLLKLMTIQSVMPSNHLILCYPLLLLPSIFPSIRVFSSESTFHIRWPKYWSFSISTPHKYSGLISFSIDWFDLLAAQGTLQESSRKHQFFSTQPSLWCNSHSHIWLLEKRLNRESEPPPKLPSAFAAKLSRNGKTTPLTVGPSSVSWLPSMGETLSRTSSVLR